MEATSPCSGNAFRLTGLHLGPPLRSLTGNPPFSLLFARALLAFFRCRTETPLHYLFASGFCIQSSARLVRIPHPSRVQGQPAAFCLFGSFSLGDCLRTNGPSLSVRRPKFLIALQSYATSEWRNPHFCRFRQNRFWLRCVKMMLIA